MYVCMYMCINIIIIIGYSRYTKIITQYINIKQTNYTYNRILLYDSGIILERMAVALAQTRWTLSRP